MNSPVIYKTNDKNQLHCEDGPAMIQADGSAYYYVNGALHREDGPAIINSNGNVFWLINGQPHRADGPSSILSDGTVSYHLYGISYTKEEFEDAKAHRQNVRKLLTSAWV